MAVAYKSAGAGAEQTNGGGPFNVSCPATVDAGDILIAQLYARATTTPSTPGWVHSPPSGWTLLRGPDAITPPSNDAYCWVYGKIADGSEDGASLSWGETGVTNDCRFGRIYSFSGYVSGTITDVCLGFSYVQTNASTINMPTVTTTQKGSLAVALVYVTDDNGVTPSTGESGGDWTEPVADYANAAPSNDCCLELQVCTPTNDPGTVSGGTSSMSFSDPSGVIGFEIRPSIPSLYLQNRLKPPISRNFRQR